jgi:hypothetical protein
MKATSRIGCALLLITCSTGLLSPWLAGAHEFWLSPSSYRSSSGTVEFGAAVGVGFRGGSVPWSPARCVRFLARVSEAHDLCPEPQEGDFVWTRFPLADDGGAMIGYESAFTPIELPAAVFDSYLEDEGLDEALRARRSTSSVVPGRERFRRCAKLWVAGRELARAIEPLGLPLEIVPETRPGVARELSLRVLESGRPTVNALVKAWRRPLLPTGRPAGPETRDSTRVAWEGRTDP